MNPQPIIVERTFAAPIQKVWEAITDKDQMKQWYFDLPEFRAEVGFRFEFIGQSHSGTEYLHLCEITEVVVPHKLTYSWRYSGLEGISYVTFELSESGSNTTLKLTHAGLESFPQDNPDLASKNFVEGWTALISQSLQTYLTPTI